MTVKRCPLWGAERVSGACHSTIWGLVTAVPQRELPPPLRPLPRRVSCCIYIHGLHPSPSPTSLLQKVCCRRARCCSEGTVPEVPSTPSRENKGLAAASLRGASQARPCPEGVRPPRAGQATHPGPELRGHWTEATAVVSCLAGPRPACGARARCPVCPPRPPGQAAAHSVRGARTP